MSTTEDGKIIAMFRDRDERAVEEFLLSYRRLCMGIAREITGDERDAEECVSDTCLRLWNSIPPEKPVSLRSYAAHITKNLALNRAESAGAAKRSAILEELDECTVQEFTCSPEELLANGMLSRAIDEFLETLAERDAVLFVRRYWYSEPVKEIAGYLGITENAATKRLTKTRKKLKKFLTGKGVYGNEEG
ncbi:MAG: sigma-70 family RNA polymerase sigma factor [Clostridia bacterium]|nr:sigma-70 family RNA polymerase sigma factor [Clostridia bacterium]